MSTEYKPHLLEWTDEKISRFWNFRNNNKAYDDTWFTKKTGKGILKLVNKHASLKGKVLDYGTGKGFLVQYLLEGYPDAEIYACDFTDGIVKETGEKFSSYKSFKGSEQLTVLPSVYKDNFFDFVFLIETVEHLSDNYLNATFIEINRILKPGGHIVITTPNAENLEKTYVHCADCGATFHHMQHLRSWNDDSLQVIAGQFGFLTVYCKGINMQWYGRYGFLHYLSYQGKKVFGEPIRENLIYMGKKN